jgi:hypothetical protein
MMNRRERDLRHRLAKKIDANGGYSDRDGVYALSWSVPVYGLGRFDLVPELVKDGYFRSPADVLLRYPDIEAMWDDFREIANEYDPIEDVQEGVRDCDTYRMWREKFARRNGFSYTGLGAEKPFDVEFEFHGRSGKHLCVTEFQGLSLIERRYEARLMERLADPAEYWDTTWMRQLCGMIDEWDVCFTEQAAQEEARYLTLNRFVQWLDEREDEGDADQEAA